MVEVRLTSHAEADLAGIADYSIETFGIEQARRYRDDLDACFRTIAGNPRLGRSAEVLSHGLRRIEHRSHVVFYLVDESGILIVRILHSSMDSARHFSGS